MLYLKFRSVTPILFLLTAQLCGASEAGTAKLPTCNAFLKQFDGDGFYKTVVALNPAEEEGLLLKGEVQWNAFGEPMGSYLVRLLKNPRANNPNEVVLIVSQTQTVKRSDETFRLPVNGLSTNLIFTPSATPIVFQASLGSSGLAGGGMSASLEVSCVELR